MAKEQEEKIKFDDELGTVIAKTELTSKYFGVSKATLANWEKKGCPKHAYGWYDLKAVTEWRNQNMGTALSDDEADISKLSLTAQKTYYEQKLKAAQAESAEFRNEIARGDYLPKKQAVNELKAMLLVMKSSLESLGKKLSRDAAIVVTSEMARQFDSNIEKTMEQAFKDISNNAVFDFEE